MHKRFSQSYTDPRITALREMSVKFLPDGSAEFVINESTKKYTGQRWSSRLVNITLTATQVRELRAEITPAGEK